MSNPTPNKSWEKFKQDFAEEFKKNGGRVPKRDEWIALACIGGFLLFGLGYCTISAIAPSCEAATEEYEKASKAHNKAESDSDFEGSRDWMRSAGQKKAKACR